MPWYKNWLIWATFAIPILCFLGMVGLVALVKWINMPLITYFGVVIFSLIFMSMMATTVWLISHNMLDFQHFGLWRDPSFRWLARWNGLLVGWLGIAFSLLGLCLGLYNIWKILIAK